jgi:hypothetical protein
MIQTELYKTLSTATTDAALRDLVATLGGTVTTVHGMPEQFIPITKAYNDHEFYDAHNGTRAVIVPMCWHSTTVMYFVIINLVLLQCEGVKTDDGICINFIRIIGAL